MGVWNYSIAVLSLVGCWLLTTASPADAKCFYNLAYEDNNRLDTLDDTLKMTKGANGGCYVLVDTDNFGGSAASSIASLRANGNTVGCYVSVGTVENWRSDFKKFVKGVDYQVKGWPEWPGEYMIKAGSDGNPTPSTSALMKNRISKFASLGCQYVEFDNMDIDEGNTMTNIPGSAMREYNMDLCKHTKAMGMKCMAKNTGPSDADDDVFDGLTVESYPTQKNWWGTAHTKNFIQAGKPVMISHYDEATKRKCTSVWAYYKLKYGSAIGFVCSDDETDQYNHFA